MGLNDLNQIRFSSSPKEVHTARNKYDHDGVQLKDSMILFTFS